MMTPEQAADALITESQKMADSRRLPDTTRYGVHRHAECEAWANAESAGGPKTELGSMWGRIAGEIADKYHAGNRAPRSPEEEASRERAMAAL